MLIHIVCWKYKAEIRTKERDLHRARLKALAGIITDIERLEVGADILHLDRSFDSGLVVKFRDREGLDRYTEHPEHQAVAALGMRISEKVVSVDFFAP